MQLVNIAAVAAILSVSLASPTTRREELYHSAPSHYQVRQSNGGTDLAFANYYLSTYHLAAGSSAAVLVPDLSNAGAFYYNATESESVTNQQYFVLDTAGGPYDASIDTASGTQVPVYFLPGPQSRIFYTNAANWVATIPPGQFVGCNEVILDGNEGVRLYWSPKPGATPAENCSNVFLWQDIISS